jgi:hemerythrin-like domain-containing protein
MHHAIDTLHHEHEAITRGLQILTRMDERVNAEHITDIQDLSALTDFLKAFADTCHHGKEEGILFPALQAKDLAQTQAPIARMLDEHAQGRRHLADMDAALQAEVNLTAFHDAARAYTALLLAHIDKEKPSCSRWPSDCYRAQSSRRWPMLLRPMRTRSWGQGGTMRCTPP